MGQERRELVPDLAVEHPVGRTLADPLQYGSHPAE